MVVGTPDYFSRHPPFKTPRELTQHNCIPIRLPTHGGIWEFEKKEQELKVRVESQLVFNNIAMRLDAVLNGLGLAYMPEDLVERHVAAGRLVRVPADWCAPFPGIISTLRAGGRPRRRSRCSGMPCVMQADGAALHGKDSAVIRCSG